MIVKIESQVVIVLLLIIREFSQFQGLNKEIINHLLELINKFRKHKKFQNTGEVIDILKTKQKSDLKINSIRILCDYRKKRSSYQDKLYTYL